MTDDQAIVRRYEHRAMATVFEILIAGEDEAFAAGAALEAFGEVDRIEQELSRFIPHSDVSRINGLPAGGSARVGTHAFECIRQSFIFREESGGMFDITMGGFVDCWIGRDGSLLHPSAERLAAAGARKGMDRLHLSESSMTVVVRGAAPLIDLGAVGKGYAVDCAAGMLKEWGCSAALVHAGRSSAYAFGDHPSGAGWPVTLTHPLRGGELIETIPLKDQSLGGSGIVRRRHIINPGTGHPVQARQAAWVLSGSAARSDALSTACMVMNADEIRAMAARLPGFRAIVVEAETGVVSHAGVPVEA